MPDLPADAITAATRVIAAWTIRLPYPDHAALEVLEAAAPALRTQGAAAERERIHQRASECKACGEIHLGYLLRGSDGHAYAPRFCSPDSTLMRRLADLLDGGDDD